MLYTSPLGIVGDSLIHIIARASALEIMELSVYFLVAERVMAARPVEINDVARVRIFQYRLRRVQRFLTDGRKLHVAIATVGQRIT
jgi:hypothetical protein